jgi:hypothetical protein
MVKIPQNIFSIPEPCVEEDEAPPLRVEHEGATAGGGEVVRLVLRSLGTAGQSGSCLTSL